MFPRAFRLWWSFIAILVLGILTAMVLAAALLAAFFGQTPVDAASSDFIGPDAHLLFYVGAGCVLVAAMAGMLSLLGKYVERKELTIAHGLAVSFLIAGLFLAA